MAQIIIPDRLAARLAHDKKWDSCVTQFTKNIEPLLAKDPDFFPDYTIHGIDHINRVLDIADHLIDYDTLSEEPQKTDLLTPRDVAFLVCGIMLHDIGMFLRPDGLRKLVKMDSTNDAFGGKPWNDEWSNYVDRTKRLSQEKMRYHFGKVIPVTEDCVDHTDTDDNKRIIGEFLRQHHARLAHEFALGMLPGSDDTDLFANINLPPKARDVIGILARSHSMAIRDIELYVKNHIGAGTKPYNTPVFYLMTVLRTADALDADERRAPEALERQQKINVPISVEEWTWNQCIDPYACDWRRQQKNYYVEANPESSRQYVQLDKWLKRVQADLDLCWSILAEKYSHPDDRYRLSIHRVVSNIYEPGIQETMNSIFLTDEVKIAANPEIVKLMIAPLYGNDPSYGIRELLQNAVDACLERKHWEERHGNPDYSGLVDIRIDGDTFIIHDNGMGMNKDILLNYYLIAGASYRNSEQWKADNAPNTLSLVSRTGRFGVGFLAAFLLGNSIEVHTQHRSDNIGFTFEFSHSAKCINVIRKIRNTGPGTSIVIKLNEGVSRALQFSSSWYSWYSFDIPNVQYSFNGNTVTNAALSLSRNPEKNQHWFPLPSKIFDLYLWNPNPSNNTPLFYCNGIRVINFPTKKLLEFGLDVPFPHISVLDNNARLEVDLARDVVAHLPDELDLYQAVFGWYIAKLLLTPWDTAQNYEKNLAYGFSLKTNAPFLFTKNGFFPNYISFLSRLGVDRYIILFGTSSDPIDLLNQARTTSSDDYPFAVIFNDPSIKTQYAFHNNSQLPYHDAAQFILDFLTGRFPLLQDNNTKYSAAHCSTAFWIHHNVSPHLPHGPIHDFIKVDFDEEKEMWSNTDSPPTDDSWHRMAIDYCNTYPNNSSEYYLDTYTTPDNTTIIDPPKTPFSIFPVAIKVELSEMEITHKVESNPDSLFAHTLQELLTPDPSYPQQDMWIPFDMAERKKKFPKAFEELKVYMDHIRKYPIE